MIVIILAYLHNLQNMHNQELTTKFFCVLAFIVGIIVDNLHHLIACIEKLICKSLLVKQSNTFECSHFQNGGKMCKIFLS